jgi:hypothetical protein
VDLVQDRVELTGIARRDDDEELGDPEEISDVEDGDLGGFLVLGRISGCEGYGTGFDDVDSDQGVFSVEVASVDTLAYDASTAPR